MTDFILCTPMDIVVIKASVGSKSQYFSMRHCCRLQRALASCGITVEQQQQSAAMMQSSVGRPEQMNANLPMQSSKPGAGVNCFPSTVVIPGKCGYHFQFLILFSGVTLD